MSYHHNGRRILTVEESSSRKRKERETFYSSSLKPSVSLNSVSGTTSFHKVDPKMPNPVLAGYMAFEFLTKGTLLGQKFDPLRANMNPIAEPRQKKSTQVEPSGKSQSYVEVASLMKSDGTHIPGIVNPTQLAQWIQM